VNVCIILVGKLEGNETTGDGRIAQVAVREMGLNVVEWI
jgi:hypothetical protein